MATLPIAFAEEEKKPKTRSIYDDEEEDSIAIVSRPGTSIAAEKPPKQEEDNSSISTKLVNGVTIRTADVLEKNISVVRKWLLQQSEKAQQEVDSVFRRYLHVERSVTSTIVDLKPENEDILPGGIYILITALSGSILSRNRSILARGIAPVVFGVGAFSYFLPQTFKNTRALIWKFEQTSPAIAETHIRTQQQIDSFVNDVNGYVDEGKQSLETGVKKARTFVAKTTGIQVPSDEGSINNEDEKKK